jgi:hypothetical protein
MARGVRGGDGDVLVGQGRASDSAKYCVAHQEFLPDVQALADCQERLALAVFSALSITHVQRRSVVIAGGQRRAHAGIHSSAEQNDHTRFCRMGHVSCRGQLLIVD